MKVGDTIVNRFVLKDRLGGGGMGVVYRAEDRRIRRTVAIKEVTPKLSGDQKYSSRLVDEGRYAARVTHEGIARIYDVIEDPLCIVMEFVDGETLKALPKPTPPEDFIDIAIQCAEALSAAHESGVTHGDIKPANIMLTIPRGPDGRRKVKVLDFGVARRLPKSLEDVTTVSADGPKLAAGTPAYMAPEVLQGWKSDHRADIFALGIVFYELLTARHPFASGNIVEAIINSQPSQLKPGLPAAVQLIIDKMLAKAADERYATSDELLVDLRALHLRGWSRRRLVLGVGAVAVLAVGVALFPEQEILDWLAGGALPDEPNIAVLPLAVTGGDEEQVAFARGLSEVVSWRLSLLTRRHPFTVVPASFVQFRGLTTPEGIGAQVGASLALGGSLEQGEKIMTAHVWFEKEGADNPLRHATVEGDRGDPGELEFAVLERIAEMLDLPIEAGDRQALVAFGTRNKTAYHQYLIGLGHIAGGAAALAVRALQEAVGLDPDFARSHVALARALLLEAKESADGGDAAKGDTKRLRDEATAHVERAVALEAELAEAHLWRGNLAFDAGDLEQAEESFLRSAYLEPANDDSLRALVGTYRRQQRYDAIEPAYRTAIDQNPRYWRTYAWLGAQRFLDGKFEESIEVMQIALAKAPLYYRSYNTLGASHAELGQWDQAARVFEKSLEIRPAAVTYSNLGTQYFYAGRYRDAVDALQQALVFLDREKRQSFGVRGNLADAFYWAPGERAKAKLQYERAIELAQADLEDGDAEAHARVATYYAMLGDTAAAEHHTNEALRRAPNDRYVLFHAAIVYQQLGQAEEAFSLVQRAVSAGTPPGKIKSHPIFATAALDGDYREFVSGL